MWSGTTCCRHANNVGSVIERATTAHMHWPIMLTGNDNASQSTKTGQQEESSICTLPSRRIEDGWHTKYNNLAQLHAGALSVRSIPN